MGRNPQAQQALSQSILFLQGLGILVLRVMLQIARGQQMPAEQGRKGHARSENREAHGRKVE